MSKLNPKNFTEWQKSFIKADTPKMPEGLTDAAQRLFKTAVSKITYTPTENGGISRSIEKLSEEEAFAIGETGTPSWSFGIPKSVREKLDAASSRVSLLGVIEAIAPLDEAAKYRLLDLERKSVLVTQHGEKFATKKPKGSRSKKTLYIYKLALENPCTKAIALFIGADKNIIGNMSEGTFANHVTDAKEYKK